MADVVGQPFSFSEIKKRNESFRQEERDWRAFQGRNRNEMALWSMIRDMLIRSHRQRWGSSTPIVTVPNNASQEEKQRAQEKANTLASLPSFGTLLSELGLPESTSWGKFKQLLKGDASHSANKQHGKDFIEFSQKVWSHRNQLEDSIDDLIEAFETEVMYEGVQKVNFRQDYRNHNSYRNKLTFVAAGIQGIGTNPRGREYIAQQLYMAYRSRSDANFSQTPAFDPFELLEPSAEDLVEFSHQDKVSDIETYMKSPDKAVGQCEYVDANVIRGMAELTCFLIPGLVYLTDIAGTDKSILPAAGSNFPVGSSWTVSETDVATIVSNLLGRYLRMFIGDTQQLNSPSGQIQMAKLSLTNYFDKNNLNYKIHVPSNPNQELQDCLETIRNIHSATQANQSVSVPAVEGKPSGMSKHFKDVGGSVASLMLTTYDGIREELDFEASGTSASIAYSLGLWNLVAGCIENGNFQLPKTWELNKWMGICSNFVAVLDFSGLRNAVQASFGSGADFDGNKLAKLDSSNMIIGAAKLAEPVFAVTDMISAGIGTYNATDVADTSVAIGHSLSFAGAATSLVIASITIYEAYTATAPFLIALAEAGPAGWLIDVALIAVGLLAFALIQMTKDHSLSKWLRFTIFGASYEEDVAYEDPDPSKHYFRFNGADVPFGRTRPMTDGEPKSTVPNVGRMISEYVATTRPLGYSKAEIKEATLTNRGKYSVRLYTTMDLDWWSEMWVYPIIECDESYYVGRPPNMSKFGSVDEYPCSAKFGGSGARTLHTFRLVNPTYQVQGEPNAFQSGPGTGMYDADFHRRNYNDLNCKNALADFLSTQPSQLEWNYSETPTFALEMHADTCDELVGLPWDRLGSVTGNDLHLLLVEANERVSRRIQTLQRDANLDAQDIERRIAMNSPVVRREFLPVEVA